MRHLALKILLVLALLALCLWYIFPPDQKLKKGKDLSGGVSMIYTVKVPDGSDRARVLAETTEVLKDRVNPTGVLDISIQPQGLDRVEVVMPLPNTEVLALQTGYREKLDALLAQSQIGVADLEEALRAGTTAQRFGTTGPIAEAAAALQKAYNESRQLRAQLQTLRDDGSDDAALIGGLESKIASSELAEEKLRGDLLALGIDQSRLVRAFGLPDDSLPLKDDAGKVIKDEKGQAKMGPGARSLELAEIKTQFPHLASGIDAAVAAYDAYSSKRTMLDDPEDLKRLLRGAGVLEFHIAVPFGKPEGVNIDQARAQLATGGPEAASSAVAGWFGLNKPEQWYQTDEQRQMLESDPVSYFAARDMVAGQWQGKTYLLLYTSPSKSLAHGTGTEWTMEQVTRQADEMGRPAVSFELDQTGGREMGRLTGPNVGQLMAIVLDGEVYSAPQLRSQINGQGQISGNFSEEEISYLVRVLRSGSLSARLSPEPISTSILGPTIGGDNLKHGLRACLFSVIAVGVYMLLYYWVAGIIANISLLAMGIMVFGIMSMLETSFTLPGLAAIALTVGMAVDCNVLIYERIREEMMNNKEDLRTATRIAFKRVFDTVIDGQLTNLIVCIVLVKVATAEVKGFGVAMIVGIIATLFAALIVTRLCFVVYIEVFKCKRLPMLPTAFPAVHRLLEPHIDWMGKRKIWFTGSLIVCTLGVLLVLYQGKSMLDTEFRGGVAVTMSTRTAVAGEPADPATGRLLLKRADVERDVRGIGEANAADPVLSQLRAASVLTVGTPTEDFSATSFQIKVSNPKSVGDEEDMSSKVQQAIIARFRNELDIAPELRFAGMGDNDFSRHTFPLEKERLGDNINQPKFSDPVGGYLGGVAVVLTDIEPPITADAAAKRIQRMRQQPDFSGQLARDVRVVGLELADPADPAKGFRSLAVLVRDADVDARVVDLAQFDQKVAGPEWKLASSAMQQSSSLEQVSSFSSAVARTLSAQAVVAIALSVLGILAYVWFRFASLRYSLAALAATAHDAIVALAALALSHYLANTAFGRALLIEEFRIDLNVVAALLTLIGYSLNDTIVIMDRIRENRGKLPLATAQVINTSINQTMSRTFLTMSTTLLAILILYIEGGTGIRPFAFVLLVGLVTGTYSSVAIAAPLVWAGDKQPEPVTPTRRREAAGSAGALPSTG